MSIIPDAPNTPRWLLPTYHAASTVATVLAIVTAFTAAWLLATVVPAPAAAGLALLLSVATRRGLLSGRRRLIERRHGGRSYVDLVIDQLMPMPFGHDGAVLPACPLDRIDGGELRRVGSALLDTADQRGPVVSTDG
jgi:hypothetical protein